VGFTEMAVTQDPPALIRELNDILSGFDRIVEEFGCERLKTIGDAYMAVSGLPVVTPDHATNVAAVALRMRRFLERRNETNANTWLCRIGVHSGRVVGSIVGVQKYVYDVFGPGVNTAARLEAMADPMEILISNATRKRLGRDFAFEEIGLRDIRGKGPVRVFRLIGDDALGP
jgi:class 3 adenylate cyclase